MISNGISVVQVNPYAVKQTKELEDNSQLKDDAKDPKLIANLVKMETLECLIFQSSFMQICDGYPCFVIS